MESVEFYKNAIREGEKEIARIDEEIARLKARRDHRQAVIDLDTADLEKAMKEAGQSTEE